MRRCGAALLMLAIAGCAPMAPANAPAPGPPPAATTPPSAPAPPRREPAPSAAVADSTPSADAERVLATIPEPLGGPPQPLPARSGSAGGSDTSRVRRAVPAPEAASDTLRASRGNDDDGPVPVPAATEPMRPAPVAVAPPDTAVSRPQPVSPPPAMPPASPPPASTPPPAAPDASGTCWRLQVAAPVEREKAQSRHEAAQSLLLVPMVIEHEKGLWKVRTRDCMTREAADALRRRAIDTGFQGSFVTRSTPPR